MTSPGHGAVRGSQDSTPTPETFLQRTSVLEGLNCSQHGFLLSLPCLRHVHQHLFKCLKYKRNLPPKKKKKIHSPIPQNASVWIYLVKPWECYWYLHSPKTTEKAGLEDYMCPSSSERSQEHVAQSIPLGCGLRHGVGLHQTRLNLAN